MFERKIITGDRLVGDGEPVYITTEIGINYNGSVDLREGFLGNYFPAKLS